MPRTQNLNNILKPNEMPFFWGAVGRPELPSKIRLIYAIGWFVALMAGGLQNNLTIANINEIQGFLGITPTQGAIITSCYYMGYAWTSVVLFKMRQHFGMKIFFGIVMAILLTAHGLQMFHDTFYVAATSRLLNGLVGSGLSTLCAYFALQMLPTSKKYLAMCVSVGLMQVGSPAARWLEPYLMLNENAHMTVFIDVGTTLFVLGAYLAIELPPSQIGKSFSKKDIPSIALYASGTAIFCLIFSIGNIVWWNQAWIAYGLCIGLICLISFFIIEINRKKPLINFSFVGSFQVIKLALAGAFARMCLAEQTTGATGLFRDVLGYTDYQLVHYYGIITLGALFGGIFCIAIMSYKRISLLLVLSFAMLITGSFASTNLSLFIMPSHLYLSQFVIAAASVIFIGPLFAEGMAIAMPRGTGYVLTFIGIFSFSQSVFGLLGSALIGYFIKFRTLEHLQNLINRSPDTMAIVQNSTNLSARLIKEAGVLAYGDLFFTVGWVGFGIFILLALHWLYYVFLRATPIDRELKIIGRRNVVANLKTKTLLEQMQKEGLHIDKEQ
ncbi:MFS transporter [Helicobacter sp. 11S03491-1]|uniref:MFS transporter n=1 Tax=Helicobacter sp. 11S03491-1 TaxID=1476196 RepID=UPI000BA64FF9|nr:MFS transporter [Helicobacter sp. 11S03491-1]PAF42994.1 hypothetical protein BKH45_02685 [Helicobacter sp. 11S03491-1]